MLRKENHKNLLKILLSRQKNYNEEIEILKKLKFHKQEDMDRYIDLLNKKCRISRRIVNIENRLNKNILDKIKMFLYNLFNN